MVLFGALGAAAVAGVAFAGEAFEVRDELEAAKSELSGLPATVKSGDTAAFDQASARALVHTSRADEIVRGPLWDVAAYVPFVSQNVTAVAAATEATHILVRDALPGSFAVLSLVQSDRIRFEGGGFNLEPFREALATLPAMDAAFQAASDKVSSIDRESLLPIVDDAIGEVVEVIESTAPIAHTATQTLPTALRMLGDDEPRTYLVLFQNNAEIRATGGIAAAAVIVTADDGRIALSGQTGSSEFSGAFAGRSYLDLPADTLALYDPEFALYSQNYTRTPNFPTSARMFDALATQMGLTLDGVISLDPVVLEDILGLIGDVTVEGITLTSDNAVDVLLNETYLRFPGDQAPADAFFAASSAAVFDKLVRGGWDPLKMIEVLGQATEEQRVYGWFTREDEEAAAVALGIDGRMASDNAETTEVGIFLNDSGVSKLEYYLSTAVDVSCDPASRRITTTLTMTSAVDRDDLTFHILSRRTPTYGGATTSMLLDVLYFAPPGSTVESVSPAQGDARALARSSTEDGRAAQSITVLLDRGETRSVSYTSVLPDGPLGPISVRTSPTVGETPITIADSCGQLVSAP